MIQYQNTGKCILMIHVEDIRVIYEENLINNRLKIRKIQKTRVEENKKYEAKNNYFNIIFKTPAKY